ncbi:MAG TPA: SCO1664 family protein [Anaerolineaceae bacterium]|jgi:uncharacterized repeat protein (TIGR03843 family)|nr:SCO1664 family protein [Anaerolineaceae bacterium]
MDTSIETEVDVLNILRRGDVELEGQFIRGSNGTFLARVTLAERNLLTVYKPIRGEQPLWDFPHRTLARREAAAYCLSAALGWGLVPPTVYRRRKAPLGPGSLQLFIDHDPNRHYFSFSPEEYERLRPAALFDLLLNNADRKGGHVLMDAQNHLWLIDHGLCFNILPKLRTVIWNFAGEDIPAELCMDLERVLTALNAVESPLRAELTALLSAVEVKALVERMCVLLAERRFPQPPGGRRAYPWPPL